MPPPSDAPQPSRRVGVRLAVSLGIGAGFAWMLARGGLPIVPKREAFASLQSWALPLYLVSLGLVHWFRAVRWRFLLRPVAKVGMAEILSSSFLGFAAILFLPLRMGEVVRPYLVSRRSAVRGWEAAGTVAAERVIDGLVLSLVLFVALAWTKPIDPLPDHVGDLSVPVSAVPHAAYAALAVFVSCFALMVLFYTSRTLVLRVIRSTLGVLSKRAADRAVQILERVVTGLRFLPSPRHLLPFLGETACYWGINAAGLWLLAQGCGLHAIGFGQACVVMGCIGIGILVHAGPGYFGTFQIAGYLALALYVAPAEVAVQGSAYVFLAYSAQLAQHLLGAVVGLWLERSRRSSGLPSARAVGYASEHAPQHQRQDSDG